VGASSGVQGQRGPGAEGSGGEAPEAEHNYTFHKPIFAEFWCHFGKIPSLCKLLKLAPTCPLAVSFVSINDVALTS